MTKTGPHTIYERRETKELIKLVHLNEVIWNPGSVDYRDQYKRKKAWMDIAGKLKKEFYQMSESDKEKSICTLKKRWSNIRSGYQGNYGNGRKCRYRYARYLCFLKPLLPLARESAQKFSDATQIHEREVDDDHDENTSSSSSQSSIPTHTNGQHFQPSKEPAWPQARPLPAPVNQILNPPQHDKNHVEFITSADADMQFCLSLATELRTLTPDKKRQFKAEVFRMLHFLHQSPVCQQPPHQVSYPYHSYNPYQHPQHRSANSHHPGTSRVPAPAYSCMPGPPYPGSCGPGPSYPRMPAPSYTSSHLAQLAHLTQTQPPVSTRNSQTQQPASTSHFINLDNPVESTTSGDPQLQPATTNHFSDSPNPLESSPRDPLGSCTPAPLESDIKIEFEFVET